MLNVVKEGKFEYTGQSGLAFEFGVVRIWAIQEGWQTADLIDGYFTNHKKFKDLDEAIKYKLLNINENDGLTAKELLEKIKNV